MDSIPPQACCLDMHLSAPDTAFVVMLSPFSGGYQSSWAGGRLHRSRKHRLHITAPLPCKKSCHLNRYCQGKSNVFELIAVETAKRTQQHILSVVTRRHKLQAFEGRKKVLIVQKQGRKIKIRTSCVKGSNMTFLGLLLALFIT